MLAFAGEWERAQGKVWVRDVRLMGVAARMVAVEVREWCGWCDGHGERSEHDGTPHRESWPCWRCKGTGEMPKSKWEREWARQQPIDDPENVYLTLQLTLTNDDEAVLTSMDGESLDLPYPYERYVVSVLPRIA